MGLIGKRDADAEPEADADALLYAGAFTSPLVYGANAHYYNGAFPYRTYGLNAAFPAYTGYSGLTGYTGLTGYRHLIGKRDADAEPEADADALLYNAAYTSPLVYGANAFYNNYYNGAFPYTTYGYRAAYPAYTGYTGYTGFTGFTGYRHLIGK